MLSYYKNQINVIILVKDYESPGNIYTRWGLDGRGKSGNGWDQIVSVMLLKFV